MKTAISFRLNNWTKGFDPSSIRYEIEVLKAHLGGMAMAIEKHMAKKHIPLDTIDKICYALIEIKDDRITLMIRDRQEDDPPPRSYDFDIKDEVDLIKAEAYDLPEKTDGQGAIDESH